MGDTRDAILKGDRAAVGDTADVEQLKRDEPALINSVLKDGTHEGLLLALELGFDVNAFDSYTPLHHAAAANDIVTMELLLARGADTTVHDDEYDTTPLGWAKFFDAKEAAAFLEGK
jgi:ankyrin repeat protein